MGATDTENSIIDVDKCTGCGVCAKACPSGAITMMPKELPPQQAKDDAVVRLAEALLRGKTRQEKAALQIMEETEDDGLYRLCKALARSSRLVAEDINREAGYMLPRAEIPAGGWRSCVRIRRGTDSRQKQWKSCLNCSRAMRKNKATEK